MTVRPARVGLLAVLLIAVGFCVRHATAGESPIGKIIADIVPVNNKLHPKEHVLGQMKSKAGKAYDETQIAEDVRRLIATKWFAPGGVEIATTKRKSPRTSAG